MSALIRLPQLRCVGYTLAAGDRIGPTHEAIAPNITDDLHALLHLPITTLRDQDRADCFGRDPGIEWQMGKPPRGISD
jgi:hypothetical protein